MHSLKSSFELKSIYTVNYIRKTQSITLEISTLKIIIHLVTSAQNINFVILFLGGGRGRGVCSEFNLLFKINR